MDEMNIVSKFTTGLISKIVTKVIHSKAGYDLNLKVNKVNTKVENGKIHAHLDLDVDLSNDELLKILKNVGLG